jgi:hypothetical protein
MVSSTVALLGALAFLLLFNVPVLYLTWASYRRDEHSPAELREDAEPDAETA